MLINFFLHFKHVVIHTVLFSNLTSRQGSFRFSLTNTPGIFCNGSKFLPLSMSGVVFTVSKLYDTVSV